MIDLYLTVTLDEHTPERVDHLVEVPPLLDAMPAQLTPGVEDALVVQGDGTTITNARLLLAIPLATVIAGIDKVLVHELVYDRPTTPTAPAIMVIKTHHFKALGFT